MGRMSQAQKDGMRIGWRFRTLESGRESNQSPITRILPDGTKQTISAEQYKQEQLERAKQKKGRRR